VWKFLKQVEFIDSDWDANVAAWTPARSALGIDIAQCAQSFHVVNNVFTDMFSGVRLQGSDTATGGECPAPGGRRVSDIHIINNVFDLNAPDDFHAFVGAAGIKLINGGDDPEETIGDVTITGNSITCSNDCEGAVVVADHSYSGTLHADVITMTDNYFDVPGMDNTTAPAFGAVAITPRMGHDSIVMNGNSFAGFATAEEALDLAGPVTTYTADDQCFDPTADYRWGGAAQADLDAWRTASGEGAGSTTSETCPDPSGAPLPPDPPAALPNSVILGLIPVNATTTTPQVIQTLAHPTAAGLAIRTQWSVIETSQGVYDWSIIDDLLDAMPGGWLASIRVGVTKDAPSWVLNDAAVPVVDYWETVGGSMREFPKPWDADYQTWLDGFIAKLGEKYNDDPRVAWVHITGASRSTEMYLPILVAEGGPNIDWAAEGYTPAILLGAYQSIFASYAAHLPTKRWPLALSNIVSNDGALELISEDFYTNYPLNAVPKIATFKDEVLPGANFILDALLDFRANGSNDYVIEPDKPATLPQSGIDWLDNEQAHVESYPGQLDQMDFAPPPANPKTCYAAPTASGWRPAGDPAGTSQPATCGTAVAPTTVQDFWAVAGPGDTLCLLDGVYRGDDSMLVVPSSVDGTAGFPVTIGSCSPRMITGETGREEFAVRIDGEHARQTVSVDESSYITLRDFDAHNADTSVVSLGGSATECDHITVERVVAWQDPQGSPPTTAPDPETETLDVNRHGISTNVCRDVTIDHFATFGHFRKGIQIFRALRATVTNFISRWDGHYPHDNGGGNQYAVSAYRSFDTVFANGLVFSGGSADLDVQPTPYDPLSYGLLMGDVLPWEADRDAWGLSPRSQWDAHIERYAIAAWLDSEHLGTVAGQILAKATASDDPFPGQCSGTWEDVALHAGDDANLTNVLDLPACNNVGQETVTPGSGCCATADLSADRLLIIGGNAANAYSLNADWGATFDENVYPSAPTSVMGTDRVDLCFRRDATGAVTTDPMWGPWGWQEDGSPSMELRFAAATRVSAYDDVLSVTQEFEERFGPMRSACRRSLGCATCQTQ
jgi:hypothetical protein